MSIVNLRGDINSYTATATACVHEQDHARATTPSTVPQPGSLFVRTDGAGTGGGGNGGAGAAGLATLVPLT